jgi:two-component system cell cycle sensor histidine kinase/response regulator CckA
MTVTRASAIPTAEGETPPSFAGDSRPTGILVVDDEPSVCRALQAGLDTYGYRPFTARSGPEALAQFQDHRDRIALVLLDVQMPGQNGPQVLEELQRIDPKVRCCFMSGQLGAFSPDELLRLGAVQVLSKPFGLADLAQTLEDLVGPPEPGPADLDT